MAVLVILCPMRGLLLRMVSGIVVSGRVIDVRHHWILWMHIMSILVLDVIPLWVCCYDVMITVVYASGTWICALWLMLCRMSIGMSCSIIYVDASDCIGPYSLCIDGVIDHFDVLCFSDAYM